MPPAMVVNWPATMPAAPCAEIVPLLLMPPAKVVTWLTKMPLPLDGVIVPALTMPPPALALPNAATWVTQMPNK